MRVHILAKELGVPSKTIIEKCAAEGIDSVKNHMSTLSAGLHATILEWFSDGQSETALETAAPIDLSKLRKRSRKQNAAPAASTADAAGPTPTTAIKPRATRAVAESATAVAERDAIEPEIEDEIAADEAEADVEPTPVEAKPAAATAGAAAPTDAETHAAEAADDLDAAPPDVQAVAPADAEPADTTVAEPEAKEPEPKQKPTPAGPQNVPLAAKLQGPRVVRYEAPDHDVASTRSRRVRRDAEGGTPAGAPSTTADAKRPGRKGWTATRRGGVRPGDPGEKAPGWRDRDLEERRERLAGATGRRSHRRRAAQGTGTAAQKTVYAPKTRAVVHEPVRLKEFCAETGLNFMQIFKVLKDEHGLLPNINMTIPSDTAQLLALNFGLDLEVVPARTKLDELQDEVAGRERKNLHPRPTVVAVLGHVDHGKTTLLDAIRRARVAAGEDGGITQHISSYHIETARGAVTFVDTPGHEAFTAMRARGAQVTDVVVLVVAADDGIMPQTVEAIRHAQAAKVPIVVALNKIDLGDQNKLKIYGKLAEHDLSPAEWGGEVDVIPTSATKGTGVKELVEHLADLAAVLELKADPGLPAVATVLEAQMKTGVGAVAQILVQEGTLRVGDFVVCGNAFGNVRALVNDAGERIDGAGPAMPVEVWGLDDVPSSGDKLFAVESLQRASEIATETKRQRLERARAQSRKGKSLEDMVQRRDSADVPELDLIIKADVDGSLAAIKQALGALPSDEVRLAVRHAAVGPVNDSDILLAGTCDGIIAAFRVDVSSGAKRLGEQHGVEIRPYRVIYELCDDIRKALSGLLAPEQRIESRGTADVRQVFRISKVGNVAGCYVTGGTIERNHTAKIVRDGVVVREGCRLASLRHVKEDVREVRSGMECGIRLEGFDDVHIGDTIETYEVISIARSL